MIDALRKQIGGPRDGALLRFTLGQALLARGDIEDAIAALRASVAFDTGYSAAWKALGQAWLHSGDDAMACAAWTEGINAAQRNGDVQAEKEMRVFLRRAQRDQRASDN